MRRPGVALTLLLCALLLPACTRGAARGGPITSPNQAPAFVYQAPDPADLVYTEADLSEASQIEWVGFRSAGVPYLSGGPLWGDTDREGIAHILRLVREAVPVADPQPARLNGPVGSAVVIHYRDGREVTVDHAWRRRPEGSMETVPGRYVISTVGEVASDDLDQFFRGTAKVNRVALLPPHSALQVEPYNLKPGDAIRITGHGWVGGTKAVLYWQDHRARYPLGEAPVERGAFTWSGRLPAGARSATEHGHFSFVAEVAGAGVGQTTSGPGR